MSRGGHGGSRGGGAVNGTGIRRRIKIGGVELPWDIDADLDKYKKPQDTYPKRPLPVPPKTRQSERIAVARYRAVRDRIHEGPFHSVFGEGFRVGKGAPPPKAQFDPFTGVSTYSKRYMKKKRQIPRLDTRPFVKHLFPEELWSLIDPEHGAKEADGAQQERKKRRLQITKTNRLSRLDRLEEEAENPDDEDMEEEEEEEEDKDEEVKTLSDQDDPFEEDDEDEDDDYNAERYFSDGEGDGEEIGGDDGGFDDF